MRAISCPCNSTVVSYFIWFIDICPSLQKFCHHCGVTLIRSTQKSRPAILIARERQDRMNRVDYSNSRLSNNATWNHTMWCDVMQRDAIWCDKMWCNATGSHPVNWNKKFQQYWENIRHPTHCTCRSIRVGVSISISISISISSSRYQCDSLRLPCRAAAIRVVCHPAVLRSEEGTCRPERYEVR
jgi:hypothetical protein